jgi:hypothetical protein
MTALNEFLEVRTLILPKAGLDRSECEDSIGARSSAQRFCIADGATESFDPRRWARLLTKHWVHSTRSLLTREELKPWLGALGERFQVHWTKRTLPWYAAEKARAGAFAAFLGLSFFGSGDSISWQAIAIGDSCLIHTRGERMQFCFPISDLSQFGCHPILAPSNQARLDAAMDQVVIKDGRARVGDVFLLLTDAIAAWYLQALNTSSHLAQEFDACLAATNDHGLETLISRCREGGSLRNDDVAAIRIAVRDCMCRQAVPQ